MRRLINFVAGLDNKFSYMGIFVIMRGMEKRVDVAYLWANLVGTCTGCRILVPYCATFEGNLNRDRGDKRLFKPRYCTLMYLRDAVECIFRIYFSWMLKVHRFSSSFLGGTQVALWPPG